MSFIFALVPPGPLSPMRAMWRDPGRCCLHSGLCHSWGTLNLRNAFNKKDARKLAQHLYWRKKSSLLNQSGNKSLISGGRYYLSPKAIWDIPSILGNSLDKSWFKRHRNTMQNCLSVLYSWKLKFKILIYIN